jgi:hypothetical protein
MTTTASNLTVVPKRVTEPDGAVIERFDLPTDEASLLELLRELFENHWRDITFGPIIQGAAWEMQAPCAPTHVGMLDGYITVAFGAPHFHICIGAHKGMGGRPVSAELANHRRTAVAYLYRQLDPDGAPISWGLRLFNGKEEQQLTVLLPNPFLSRTAEKVLKKPEWSHLSLWDALRARWLGLTEPDPVDRSAKGFRHG